MDKKRWNSINAIVDGALDLDEPERSAYIKQKCCGDKLLCIEVNELLQSIETATTENFLKSEEDFPNHLIADFTDSGNVDQSSLIGQEIDQYKIKELIGHGGMGSVFKAERADDVYQGYVALKLIRRGMDTPSNIARFKRERNILAKLEHPNIARLLDGGVTQDGLPYLVMEFVDGIPLDEYCNQNKLTTKERINLLKTVCEAVDHAHQNAIIHRDLKPSNILIKDDRTVKVLDFGIARMMKADNADTTLFKTHSGSRMITLGYSSPEQIEGKTITTATDTYTLGVVFYEVLAGVRPIDLKEKNITSIERYIRQYIPSKPSAKYSGLTLKNRKEIAKNQKISTDKLAKKLTGDIDAIIMKALRKEPQARYDSVAQLLEDINRYYESIPLIAKDDTVRYRIRKYIRRNGKSVTIACLMIFGILGFGSYHVYQVNEQRNLAQKEAQKATTVKNLLIDIFRSSNPQTADFNGKNLSARQLLINSKNDINKDLKNEPNVYAEVLLTIGNALENIEAFDEAEESYRLLLAHAPKTHHPLKNRTRAYVELSDLLMTRTKNKQAFQYAEKAKRLLKDIHNPAPALKASVWSCLGKIHNVIDNYTKSINYYQQADSTYIRSGLERSSGHLDMLTWYGRSLLWNNEFEESVKTLQRSNRLHQERYANPTLTVAENYHMMALSNRELGKFETSTNNFLSAIELKSKLAGPQSFTAARSIYHLSRNYVLMGEAEKSEEYARRALYMFQQRADSLNGFTRLAKNYIAIALCEQDELLKAEKLFKQIIDRAIQERGPNHIAVAYPEAELAVVYQKRGEYEKAIPLLKRAIQINKETEGKKSRGAAVEMNKLGAVFRDMGKYEQAEKYFREAQAIYEKELQANHYRKGELYLEYGKLKKRSGHPEEAEQYFQKALKAFQFNYGADDSRAQKAKKVLVTGL